MNNKKHYITVAEILETMEESFGLSDWSTVKEELKTMKSPVNFTGKTSLTLKENTFGMVPLLYFMDELENNSEALSVDELKEYLKDTESFEWFENKFDNTYNYSGYLERDINFCTFNNEETYETLVFIAIHVGLDIRAGYTKYFAFKCENDYDFWEVLGQTFDIAYFKYTNLDNKEQLISIEGSAISDDLSVYLHETGDAYYAYELLTDVDLFNEETAIESISNLLEEKGIDFQENSLKVVE